MGVQASNDVAKKFIGHKLIIANPLLAIEPIGDGSGAAVLYNPLTNKYYSSGYERHISAIALCQQWTKSESYISNLSTKFELDTYGCEKLFLELLEHSFLLYKLPEVESFLAKLDKNRKSLGDAAVLLHLNSNDYPFLDYGNPKTPLVDSAMMSLYSHVRKMPSSYRTYESDNEIKLEFPDRSEPITSDNSSDSLSTLGKLFWYSFGRIGRVVDPIQGELVLRTFPSGGSRHPVEMYFINRRLASVPQGIYHYNVQFHQLSKLSIDLDGLIDSSSDFQMVLTLSPARSMWRYREPRSSRVLFLDLGHAARNVERIFSDAGLCLSEVQMKADSKLGELLGFEKFTEIPCVLYEGVWKK